jgi:hypothetical protein
MIHSWYIHMHPWLSTFLKSFGQYTHFWHFSAQVGFVRRPAIWHVDGRPLSVSKSLREEGCNGPIHDIDVRPSRVGCGTALCLRVVCVHVSKPTEAIDSFQALLPCKYARHEPAEELLREMMYTCIYVLCMCVCISLQECKWACSGVSTCAHMLCMCVYICYVFVYVLWCKYALHEPAEESLREMIVRACAVYTYMYVCNLCICVRILMQKCKYALHEPAAESHVRW